METNSVRCMVPIEGVTLPMSEDMSAEDSVENQVSEVLSVSLFIRMFLWVAACASAGAAFGALHVLSSLVEAGVLESGVQTFQHPVVSWSILATGVFIVTAGVIKWKSETVDAALNDRLWSLLASWAADEPGRIGHE